MRLLIVEDDKTLAQLLVRHLSADYTIDLAHSGKRGLFKAFAHEYDVILLDLQLPDASGFELCKEVRRNGVTTPLVILTARGEIDSKVLLFNAGADDYILKPFNIVELRARLRAVMRRGQLVRPTIIQCGPFLLNPLAQSILFHGTPLMLSKKEFQLVEYLLKHTDQVISRLKLLEHIWEGNPDAFISNTVDVHISNIRRKIGRPLGNEIIKTIHGTGYMLVTH